MFLLGWVHPSKKMGLCGCSIKTNIFSGWKSALGTSLEPAVWHCQHQKVVPSGSCHDLTKRFGRCPPKLDLLAKNWFWAPKTGYWAPKRSTLAYWGQEMACRTAIWASTKDLKVSRVILGYRCDIVPLSQVCLSKKWLFCLVGSVGLWCAGCSFDRASIFLV